MYLCVLTVTCVCGTCSFELPFPTLFCVFCLAGNTSESWPLHITFTAIQVFNIYMTKGILEIENYWFWWLHKKKKLFHHTLNLNIYYFHHLLQNLTERFWPVHFSEHAQCSGTVKCEAHLNRFTWFGSLGFQVFFFNISSS